MRIPFEIQAPRLAQQRPCLFFSQTAFHLLNKIELHSRNWKQSDILLFKCKTENSAHILEYILSTTLTSITTAILNKRTNFILPNRIDRSTSPNRQRMSSQTLQIRINCCSTYAIIKRKLAPIRNTSFPTGKDDFAKALLNESF